MSDDANVWLRRLWLVNGIILLLAFIIAAAVLGYAVTDSLRGPDGIVATRQVPNDADGAMQARAVRLSDPDSIRGTRTRLIRVSHGAAYSEVTEFGIVGSASRSSYYPEGPLVNAMFVHAGGEARLLFDTPALITDLEYPSDARDQAPLQRWVACLAVVSDTNGNGGLDTADRTDLFVTDLDGGNVRRVLDDTYTVLSAVPFAGGSQAIVYALQLRTARPDAAKETLPVRVFLYDPETGVVTQQSALNRMVEQAGRILAK